MVNSSSCENLFDHHDPPSKHYPKRTMLNFRDSILRVRFSVQESCLSLELKKDLHK